MVRRQGKRRRQKGDSHKNNDDDELLNIYANPRAPGSFSGAATLKHYSGRSDADVKKFLSGLNAYTIHKPRRLRFRRRRTFSKGIGDLFQADLVDVHSLSPYNDNMRYLLTCIDVFTKRAWVVPIRTKSGQNVSAAFKKILAEFVPNMLQTDKGSEFRNSTFQMLLQRYKIKFYTSENDDIKASVVERYNRTLKTKMYRYFTHNNTRRYLDVLDDLLESYNNTKHRSFGMAPMQVNAENQHIVRQRLYPVKGKKSNSNSKKVIWFEWPNSGVLLINHTWENGQKKFLK